MFDLYILNDLFILSLGYALHSYHEGLCSRKLASCFVGFSELGLYFFLFPSFSFYSHAFRTAPKKTNSTSMVRHKCTKITVHEAMTLFWFKWMQRRQLGFDNSCFDTRVWCLLPRWYRAVTWLHFCTLTNLYLYSRYCEVKDWHHHGSNSTHMRR